jgi:hypothetical protein
MFKKVYCRFSVIDFYPSQFFSKDRTFYHDFMPSIIEFFDRKPSIFTYVVSKCAEFYPHFKYDVLFFIGLFYERCLTSWWGGGGGVGGSQGWSHKVRGDQWAYRTWGVWQSLRGNRRVQAWNDPCTGQVPQVLILFFTLIKNIYWCPFLI